MNLNILVYRFWLIGLLYCTVKFDMLYPYSPEGQIDQDISTQAFVECAPGRNIKLS